MRGFAWMKCFYLLVIDEAARIMGLVRVLIPFDYVGLGRRIVGIL